MNQRARGITNDGQPIFAESIEQETVANWLTINGVFFIHVPNEVPPMRGDRRAQAIWIQNQRRKGVKAGVSDFIVFDRPPFVPSAIGAVLELKALDGKNPGEDQTAFLQQMKNRGYLGHWCKGSGAAIAWFESLGYQSAYRAVLKT